MHGHCVRYARERGAELRRFKDAIDYKPQNKVAIP
jgi:hypothetical protein